MNFLYRIPMNVFLLLLLVIPGTAFSGKADRVDSFFDITYRITENFDDERCFDGTQINDICVTVMDNSSKTPIPVDVREVHRFGDDPDDLCTLRLVIDLGNKQYFRIEAEHVHNEDGTPPHIRILDVSPHNGHVTVLK